MRRNGGMFCMKTRRPTPICENFESAQIQIDGGSNKKNTLRNEQRRHVCARGVESEYARIACTLYDRFKWVKLC